MAPARSRSRVSDPAWRRSCRRPGNVAAEDHDCAGLARRRGHGRPAPRTTAACRRRTASPHGKQQLSAETTDSARRRCRRRNATPARIANTRLTGGNSSSLQDRFEHAFLRPFRDGRATAASASPARCEAAHAAPPAVPRPKIWRAGPASRPNGEFHQRAAAVSERSRPPVRRRRFAPTPRR